MRKRIVYADEPMDVGKIEDFLPPPEELVPRDPVVKVTISLSRRTVGFFKSQARRHRVPYQKMIRRLLDVYASRYAS